MSKRAEIAVAVALGLIGAGVGVGQDFEVTRWVLLFWLPALGLGLWAVFGPAESTPTVSAVPNIVFDQVRHANVTFGTQQASRLAVWEIWFRNRPEDPANRSIAQDMTAEVAFCDGNWTEVLRFVGQWAQSAMPEHVGWTELRARIDLPPINVWGKLLLLGNDDSIMTSGQWSDEDAAGERTWEERRYRPVFALAGEMLHAGGTPGSTYWLGAVVTRVRVTLTAVNMPERVFQFAIERDAEEAVIGLTPI